MYAAHRTVPKARGRPCPGFVETKVAELALQDIILANSRTKGMQKAA